MNVPTAASRERAIRRWWRLYDVLRKYEETYVRYFRWHRRHGNKVFSYDRWIGTLPKNQQIRHAELTRQRRQAIKVYKDCRIRSI